MCSKCGFCSHLHSSRHCLQQSNKNKGVWSAENKILLNIEDLEEYMIKVREYTNNICVLHKPFKGTVRRFDKLARIFGNNSSGLGR